jgi:hypothetical protein
VGQLELLAAIAVYYSLADVLRGRQVVHYIDNSGAMAILVKDYSSDLDSAQLVNTFYALTSALEVDVWFDYVKSAANIADWPSRGQVEFAHEVNATRIEGNASNSQNSGMGQCRVSARMGRHARDERPASWPAREEAALALSCRILRPDASFTRTNTCKGKRYSGEFRRILRIRKLAGQGRVWDYPTSLHRIGSSPPPFLFSKGRVSAGPILTLPIVLVTTVRPIHIHTVSER